MPTTSPVNVGIIGLGFMAATHVRAYREVPGAVVKSLCNPSGRHLDGDFSRVAGNVGATDPVILDMKDVRATRDVGEFLRDPDIHLVDICAPTAAHRDLALAALQAGKHVLCEKPLARTATVAREIVEAAGRAPGFFMPAMCLRFWPQWRWLKQAVDGNVYGRALAARFRRVAEPPGWGQQNFLNGQHSGGALFDLHIHDTDFVQYCFGRPHAVFSTGYSHISGAIDHVVTQYEVAGQTIVHAEGGWAMAPGFGFNMSYTVNFERATADYDISRQAEALRLYEPGKPPQTISCPGPDGYVEELKHLIEAILSGHPPTVVTAADALDAVEICEAEERSVQTRQPVRL